MRPVLWLLLMLLSLRADAQSVTPIPLPVADASGRAFDSTDGQTLSGVLVGFLIPATGPITSVAPLLSELSGDGTLKAATGGAWAGPSVAKPLRVEKPGYAVAGLRTLVTVSGRTVRTRQFQVFWKPWKDGQLSGSVIESRVYGEPAGAKDATKVVELRVTSALGSLGIYGRSDETSLSEFSLLQRPAPVTQAAPAALPAPSGPQAPQALSPPTVPVVDPLILKR